jgi:hypothetical protein
MPSASEIPLVNQGNLNPVVFWKDDNVDITTGHVTAVAPAIQPNDTEQQCVRGAGIESLAFFALQIKKTQDKSVVMRALASACSTILKDDFNYTGSKIATVPLTGITPEILTLTDTNTVVKTNFEDEEPVTVAEILEVMNADVDELGAYFGVLFLAGNKKITTENRTAFNDKRAASATASIIGKAVIFIPDSKFLTDDLLSNVYAAFLSRAPMREHMTHRIVTQLNRTHMASALAFVNMFLLLEDSGMSALRIIKEATVKYKWIHEEFKELHPEFEAANRGLIAIRTAPLRERPFVKAIHGSKFVPVKYVNIDNLLGVCKEVLKRTTPSYANYRGGKIMPDQLARISKHIDITESASREAVATE